MGENSDFANMASAWGGVVDDLLDLGQEVAGELRHVPEDLRRGYRARAEAESPFQEGDHSSLTESITAEMRRGLGAAQCAVDGLSQNFSEDDRLQDFTREVRGAVHTSVKEIRRVFSDESGSKGRGGR